MPAATVKKEANKPKSANKVKKAADRTAAPVSDAFITAKSEPPELIILEPVKDNDVKSLATKKIAKELEEFSSISNKAKAIKQFVASTLTHFCSESEPFAEAVCKTKRTLTDCCEEIMQGVGGHCSDIDTYRAAVKHYFPNAEVDFTMTVSITGDAPGDDYLNRKPAVEAKTAKRPASKPAPAPKKGSSVSTMQISLF